MYQALFFFPLEPKKQRSQKKKTPDLRLPKAWRRLYGVAGETLSCKAKASSWIHDRFIEWKIFFFRSSLITLSLKCIVIVLFNNALQQRFLEIVYPEHAQ